MLRGIRGRHRIPRTSGIRCLSPNSLLFQQRNAVHRRGLWQRLKKRVKIGSLLVVDDLRRIRRHLARGLPNIGNKSRIRDRVLIQPWSGGIRSLSLAAMTLVPAVFHEECLSILGITTRGVRRWWILSTGQHGQNQQQAFHASSYRGWLTTSTNAGSPRLTRARARFIAGPRSFGSVIGP